MAAERTKVASRVLLTLYPTCRGPQPTASSIRSKGISSRIPSRSVWSVRSCLGTSDRFVNQLPGDPDQLVVIVLTDRA